MSLQDNIAQAHSRMNAVNAEDPTKLETSDGPRARELVMAERLEAWVHQIAAAGGGSTQTKEPSTALLLASRGQHLARWTVPRSSYDPGRVGYLKWRKDLSKMHADKVSEILSSLNFDEETKSAVREINLKQGLKTNADAQAMEDALCLSFLEHEYSAFCAKHPDEKVVDIVQKSWRKMSPLAHDLALRLPFDDRPKELVLQALGGPEGTSDAP